jgi:predicted ferric reductase
MCIMLLLAARMPIVDRAIGHDRALQAHNKLGKPVLYLLLAHGVFLLIGYGAAEGLNPVAEIASMWQGFADMPWAFIGLALLVVVVISSVVAVRRRFPYEVWYVIHLLTYVGVIGSIPHQFSVGGLFAQGTLQRWYWLALYVFTAAALITFRVLVPLIQSTGHDLRVSRVRKVGPGVVSIEMTGRNLDKFESKGGQFFQWRFLAKGLWWHPHPFSLSARPTDNTLRITIRNLGVGTARLAKVLPGTRVAIEGPYGMFSEDARSSPRVVLVGSGIGIAPIRSLLEDLSFESGNAVVIVRASNDREIFLGSELQDLCRRRGAYLYVVSGRRSRKHESWQPASALAAGHDLSSYAPAIASSDVYICGPDGWTDLVVRDAVYAGVPQDQIHYERFGW